MRYQHACMMAAVAMPGILLSYGEQGKDAPPVDTTTPAVCQAKDCDITFGGIHFTKMRNDADTCIEEKDGVMTMTATHGQDFFIDPSSGKANTSSPILLAEVDNTKPFTIQAKIKTHFTQDGTYNAGVLFLYDNDEHWQKFCFEQDERGNHRVVTVRTVGTSDDNNSEVVSGQDFIYFKYSSDTNVVGSYYSFDGETWYMARLYRNDYPAKLYVGISNQCPTAETSKSEFSQMSLTQKAVENFRLGQ